MSRPVPDLSAPNWTHELARRLERAASAVARLDARICVSSSATAWRQRTSWAGYAAALRAHGVEIDEIDIFSHQCGVAAPGRRPLLAATIDELGGLAPWQASLAPRPARHWAEDLPFRFDPPADWGERPALLRALELTAHQVRCDASAGAWLAFPDRLRRLGLTATALPPLMPADPALRRNPYDSAIVPRYLRTLADQAEAGLARLDAIEADRLRAAAAIAAEHRVGNLPGLAARLMATPATSPRATARAFGITISGAGKLLKRAAQLGLAVEISGRQAWRVYLAPEVALAYGFVTRPRGRPRTPALPEPATLDRMLAEFDAAVARFDAETRGLAGQLDDEEDHG